MKGLLIWAAFVRTLSITPAMKTNLSSCMLYGKQYPEELNSHKSFCKCVKKLEIYVKEGICK